MPSRELGMQVFDYIQALLYHLRQTDRQHVFLAGLFIGGLPLEDDIQRLKKDVDILVGTPGRIL